MVSLSCITPRHRTMSRFGVFAATALLLLPGVAPAQQPGTEPRTHYTNNPVFYIPFTADQGGAGIKQIILYVSDDFGRTYKPVASNTPQNDKFLFKAPSDGSFLFSVQTEDTAGRRSPPNINLVAPSLKVVVDRTAPVITLTQGQTTTGAAVDYAITEENPDFATLRADYRTVGSRDWLSIQVPPRLRGQLVWTPTVLGPWEVRVQMNDKPGNHGEQTITVNSGGWKPGGTPPPVTGPGGPRPNVILVNSLQFQLNYRLDNAGKSGVERVEIYRTENEGRTWELLTRDATRNVPYTVQVQREGIYGFWVAPVSGVGRSNPPVSGSPPQAVVEVDLTKPKVVLLGSPAVGVGPDLNKVTIRYTASDRNLAPNPIRIFWAKGPTDVWNEVAKDLPNEGIFVWLVPDPVPAQFYLKVEAVDLAGNVGGEMTRETVKVDPNTPIAVITEIKPATIAPPPPPP